MSEHHIEIYAPKGGNILAGLRYARIQMPSDSTQKEILIAAEAAKAAISQVLGRLGVHPELKFVYIPNAATEEQEAAIRAGVADGITPVHTLEEVMNYYGVPVPENE